MAPKAIVFDYGLTLVRFDYPRSELMQVLAEVLPWLGPGAPNPETLMRTVLEPLEEEVGRFGDDEVVWMDVYEAAWRRAGVHASKETLYRILDLEQQVWDRHVQVADGALETLAELRTRGVRTAVASNAPFPPEMMRRQMAFNGIAEVLDVVVLSSEVGKRKPSPELYLSALDLLSVKPAEAIYVGDRVREDYYGPRAVGMGAVICTQLAREAPPPGVPVISRLSDLLDRL